MSKTSEIGYALAGWNIERNMSPWCQSYNTCNNYAWESPAKIFNSVRYACFETSLRLAAWEIGNEVPESRKALKFATWCARSAIQQNCGHYWPRIRNRYGSKRMKKVLASVIARIEPMSLVVGDQCWNGYFTYSASNPAQLLAAGANIGSS